MKEIVITLNDQGGDVMSWNTNELANTLRAMASRPPVIVVKEKGMNDEDDGMADKIIIPYEGGEVLAICSIKTQSEASAPQTINGCSKNK